MKKPDHVFEGVYLGVRGGVSELVGGVTGIFTKPIQKTKQEGAKGFFKGFGSGLMGAVAAPITATLRVGSQITEGVSTSASKLGSMGKGGTAVYSRFRPPRYINTKNVIQPYLEEIAYVKQILSEIHKGKYAYQSIRYFTLLPETKPTGELAKPNIPDGSILIITDKMLVYVRIEREGVKRGKTKALFEIKLSKVQKVEVYKAEKQSSRDRDVIYFLVVTCYSAAKGQFKYKMQTKDYAKLEKAYNILSA